MSALSAPKLKSDFKSLYKDMRQAGVLKSPSCGLKATLLAKRKDLSAKKRTQTGSKEKQATGQSRTEPSPPIDHLFRSSGQLDSAKAVEKEKSIKQPTVVGSLRAKTSQDDRSKGSSNIVFNQKAINKGKCYFMIHIVLQH